MYLIPELDYHFSKYWKNYAELTIVDVFTSDLIKDDYAQVYFKKNSFLRLLFDLNYDQSGFVYLFQPFDYKKLPKNIRERSRSIGTITNVFITADDNTDGQNIFNLNSDDILMLNQLLQYRTTGSVDLTGIDYSALTTSLSRLIHIYLSFVSTGDISNFTTEEQLFSSKVELLSDLFAFFVLNEIHRLVRFGNFQFNLGDPKTLPQRNIVTVNDTLLNTRQFTIDKQIDLGQPSYLFLNGELLPNDQYTIQPNQTQTDIIIANTVSLKLNDILVFDYFSVE